MSDTKSVICEKEWDEGRRDPEIVESNHTKRVDRSIHSTASSSWLVVEMRNVNYQFLTGFNNKTRKPSARSWETWAGQWRQISPSKCSPLAVFRSVSGKNKFRILYMWMDEACTWRWDNFIKLHLPCFSLTILPTRGYVHNNLRPLT